MAGRSVLTLPPRWWRGPDDPVLRSLRLLVLVLWPTVWVWTLPGMHRGGSGELTVWGLAVVYSVAALLLVGAGERAGRVLPVCLPLFAVATTLGAMSGHRREMALLVPRRRSSGSGRSWTTPTPASTGSPAPTR